MASLPPSLSSLLFLTLALILISISPAFSTSRQALDDHHDEPMKTGFKVTLNHVDSGGSFTKFEHLNRAVKRASHRLNHFNERVLTAKHPKKLMTTVYSGGDGAYFMNFSIGTPPESFYGIMDTGSDLIWTQCQPCLVCSPQAAPLFDPTKSSSFSNVSCSNDLCQNLVGNCNAYNGCVYAYGYGSGFTAGFLGTETFTFEKASVPKIAFGCGLFNYFGGADFGEGLVGLGHGPLSLVSQLNEPKFSYCLTSFAGTKSSTLFLGSQPNVKGVKTTPLIQSHLIPTFYYLSLEGITIGHTKLPINKTTFALNKDGSGGLIIDSGTTITFLEESAYILVRKEFVSQIKLPVVDGSTTGLDLCFQLPSNTSSVKVPVLVFHFKGADLAFPKENYMITDSNIMCLAMFPSLGFSIFGNIQQQNILVVYDLHKETISFLPTECDKF